MILNQIQADNLMRRLKNAVSQPGGMNISSQECAFIIDVANNYGLMANENNSLRRILSMAVADIGGYITFTDEKLMSLEGGLLSDKDTNGDRTTISFLPSEKMHYYGLNDLLVDVNTKEEWIIVAKSPTGAVFCHCKDSFMVIGVDDLHRYMHKPFEDRLTIEQYQNEMKEQAKKPKIVRP